MFLLHILVILLPINFINVLKHGILETNNGSNMVAIFPLLNQKNGCKNIQCLLYTAYAFQLAIEKRLILAEILVTHTKKLINFF
jgi:hypothetical protein